MNTRAYSEILAVIDKHYLYEKDNVKGVLEEISEHWEKEREKYNIVKDLKSGYYFFRYTSKDDYTICYLEKSEKSGEFARLYLCGLSKPIIIPNDVQDGYEIGDKIELPSNDRSNDTKNWSSIYVRDPRKYNKIAEDIILEWNISQGFSGNYEKVIDIYPIKLDDSHTVSYFIDTYGDCIIKTQYIIAANKDYNLEDDCLYYRINSSRIFTDGDT